MDRHGVKNALHRASAGLADLLLHLVRDARLLEQYVHALGDVLVSEGGGLHGLFQSKSIGGRRVLRKGEFAGTIL